MFEKKKVPLVRKTLIGYEDRQQIDWARHGSKLETKRLTKNSGPPLKPHNLVGKSGNTTEDCNRPGSMVIL